MRTNNYNLQILHHEETFATRELALAYLNDYYKPYSLEAEPIIVKYGDEKSPNLILAFGTTSSTPGGFYSIDMAKANEDIAALLEKTSGDNDEVKAIGKRINEIVKSTGLDFDDNKIKDKITYKPDVKDTLIGEATTIAEAVDLLSKHISKTDFSVKETDSVKLTYETNAEGKTELFGDVKVSTDGDTDKLGFNDNLIGIKSDGLYAATNLEFDADKQELIFTRSGYENNKFLDDAVVKTIKLGEKTEAQISELSEEVKKKIEDISVEQNGLQYNLLVDGKKVGTITVPEDQFFKGASYDSTTKILTLRFTIIKDGKIEDEIVNISVSDLVDVYEAGDGLVLNDNKFSVKKNNESETYLTVSDEGIGIFGIDKALDALSEEVKKNNFAVQNSDTIKTTLTKAEDSDTHVFQSELKIKTLDGTDTSNIIKKDANGVYATVKLTYDKDSNKLIFNEGNGDKEFELNTITVENTKNSPIVLTKNNNVLTADVSILNDTQKHNLLANENSSLFVNGDSNSHYALWGDEETNVQAVLNIIKPNVDKIPTIEQNAETAKNNTVTILNELGNIQTDLEDIKTDLVDKQTDIDTNTNAIKTNSEIIQKLEGKVDGNTTNIDEINNTTIPTLDNKIINLENLVNSYEDRIKALEKVVTQLIDFGIYTPS